MRLPSLTRHLHLIAALLLAGFSAHAVTATSDVVVANRDLFPNETISAGDIHVAQVRDTFPNAFTSAASLTGLQVVSRIPKGYPVVKGSVRGKPGVGLTLADAIPDGDHAIYRLDARHANLPAGYVKPGDEVLVSIVLKVDERQQAQVQAALATPTPISAPSEKPTSTATPSPAPGTPGYAPPQGSIILGSAYLAAPVVASDGLDGKGVAPGTQPWLSVLLSIDDLNALNTLVNSGFADTTVSLADSRIKPVGTVNTLASLVAVLERRRSVEGAVAPEAGAGQPGPVVDVVAAPSQAASGPASPAPKPSLAPSKPSGTTK